MFIVNWQTLQNYYYKRRRNKVPQDYYLGKYKKIANFFHNRELTTESVDAFIDWIEDDFYKEHGKPISSSYYNKYLSMLKVIAKLSGVDISDYKGRNEAVDRVTTEKLTLDEYHRLMKTKIPYERDSDYRNFRDLLTIKVMVITTQRPGNIYKLKWSNFRNGYLYFEGVNLPKNGKPHKVFIPPHIQDEIRQLRRFAHGYIFATTERGPLDRGTCLDMIKTRCKVANIKKNITAKSMRGTGATGYLRELTLQDTAKITGHEDPSVLLNHYYDPEDGRIEDAISNNPFDPEPLTREKKIHDGNKFVENYLKKGEQATLILQDKGYMIYVPF